VRILDQATMHRVFDVTDALELSREAITVPLAPAGDGAVRRLASGRYEITLPDAEDLGPFLAALPERLRALGA
jgi:hypothetical protein